MKGGEDEEKLMGSLYPRLHISEVEKKGSRAPLKNKMALPPNNSSNLVPSTSSSHGGGHERSLCCPFCNSTVSQLSERLHSCSSGGVNLNTTLMNLEWQLTKPTNSQTLNVMGHLSTTAKCSLFQPQSFSNSTNSSVKKLSLEDDFRVPTFAQLGRTLNRVCGQQNMGKEKLTSSSPNSPKKFQSACEKLTKWSSTTVRKSRQHLRIESEENPKVSQTSQETQDCAGNPASILSNGDKILADASSTPLATDGISEHVKQAYLSLNQKKGSSSVDDLSRLNDFNAQSHQEYRAMQKNKALRDCVLAEPKAIKRRNASKLKGVSCSRPSLGDNRKGDVSKFHEGRESGSLQVDVDRNDDISDTSMVDSISGLNISPDDVVRVIGQKQFQKARRVIVRQQREFAEQVFELHRLIKVQRLIAGSPNLLFEDNFSLGKPPIKVSLVKKLPSENNLEPPPLIVMPKDDSQKPNTSSESAAENAVREPPLPFLNNDTITSKELVTQQSNYEPYSKNTAPASIATDAKPAPWCFHPQPRNQWLVPVVSPSEGLVYKPYTGPCPPTARFVVQVYGSCEPMSLTPVGGHFLNTAYGVPVFHQQRIETLPGTPPPRYNYFPPYGIPVMNPSISSSAVEKVSPFDRARSNGQDSQLSMGDINFTIAYQSSHNMSSQKSWVISCCVRILQASKESDQLRGSTASCPERVKGDLLPHFPTAPTVQVLDQTAGTQSTEQQTQVIKVVPHNPRSASESAARILQSIQEERELYNSLRVTTCLD